MTVRRGHLAVAVMLLLRIELSADTAFAEPSTLAIGALRIPYDTAQWSRSPAGPDAHRLKPSGASANERGPLLIERHAMETGGCGVTIREALPREHYAAPTVTGVEVAGLTGLRATAHSRCRSAQPRGIAVCVEAAGSTYLIVSRKSACRDAGPSPFSEIDPLGDIVAGMTFAR